MVLAGIRQDGHAESDTAHIAHNICIEQGLIASHKSSTKMKMRMNMRMMTWQFKQHYTD